MTSDIIDDLANAQEERTIRCSGQMLAAIQAIDSGMDLRPSESIELLRVAIAALNKVCSSGNDYYEFTEDLNQLSPAAVGQIILKTLPYGRNLDPQGRWPASQKAYWLGVSEELGPEWIESFRAVGAFMKRVEGF